MKRSPMSELGHEGHEMSIEIWSGAMADVAEGPDAEDVRSI